MFSDKVVFPLWELGRQSDPYIEGNVVYAFYGGDYVTVGVKGEDFVNDRIRRAVAGDNIYPLKKGYTDLGSLLIDNPAPSRVFIDATGALYTHKDKSTMYPIEYFKVRDQWIKGSFRYVSTKLGTHKLLTVEELSEVGYVRFNGAVMPCNYLFKGWTKNKRRKRIKL